MDTVKIEYNIRRVRALREASKVERAHTMPHHGTYSNGEHSWNVSILILNLHPNPSYRLLVASLLHDVPERWNGDPPSPAKWGDSREKLREGYKEANKEVHYGLDLDQFGALHPEEMRWLKACDMLEYHLWCWDQINMGNARANEGRQNSYNWFANNAAIVPKEIIDFLEWYRWDYTSDIDGWKLSK